MCVCVCLFPINDVPNFKLSGSYKILHSILIVRKYIPTYCKKSVRKGKRELKKILGAVDIHVEAVMPPSSILKTGSNRLV